MVSEEKLKLPFKNQFEQWLKKEWPEAEIEEWENEYSAKAAERDPNQAPASVIERIDLVCKTIVPDAADAHYVIEIKDELNKKAVGQALNYFYAYNRDLVIRADNPDEREYPLVYPVIGFRRAKEHYIDWLEFTDGIFVEDFALIRMSIDYPHR